jgi:iron(III) transport system substrate-binding protein
VSARAARRIMLALSAWMLTAAAACGADSSATDEAAATAAGDLTLYTCVTDTIVEAVIAGFEAAVPDVTVDAFRAPTGQLNARVASDVRTGGLAADVVWACDPLTMQSYVDQGLVGGWVPDAPHIPEQYRTDDYVGAHLLYVVAVHRSDAPAPATWSDLADPVYRDAVAMPDPSFAASALGAVGYFYDVPGYGVAYLRDLHDNGAVKLSTPDDVNTGVAQGVYQIGISIAQSAYRAQADGSPIEVTWPEPGAIAVYGPVAVSTDTDHEDAARAFTSYVVGPEAQQMVAESGGYPTLPDVEGGPPIADGAQVVSPDWPTLADRQDEILRAFAAIFGG